MASKTSKPKTKKAVKSKAMVELDPEVSAEDFIQSLSADINKGLAFVKPYINKVKQTKSDRENREIQKLIKQQEKMNKEYALLEERRALLLDLKNKQLEAQQRSRELQMQIAKTNNDINRIKNEITDIKKDVKKKR